MDSFNFEREINGINHTYKVELILNNVTPMQLDNIDKILVLLEENGVIVSTENVEND